MKKYRIVYATDAGDLYSEEFKTKKEVDRWLEKNEEYKAIVFEWSKEIEDRT